MKVRWTKARKQIDDEKGQMTIFIVLIFQVLFVFFAMVTNIGLVVHEKINLQNSADLAAYYGAQKQAEVLNAIAHTNYQIRQAWKMLAFRVRVLGDFGRTGHPVRAALNTGSVSGGETGWDKIAFNPAGTNPAGVYPPIICVTHPGWLNNPGVTNTSNICKSNTSSLGTTIPNLPNVQVILPIVDNIVKSKFDNLNDQITSQCDGAGLVNWMVAAKFIVSYKFDVFNKLKRIRSLKQKLENGLDIEGQSIKAGVEKTLRGNLTGANSVQSIEWINSFSKGPSSFVKDSWLRTIRVHPAIYFVNNQGSSGCNAKLSALYTMHNAGNVIPGAFTSGNPANYGYANNSELFKYSWETGAPMPEWQDQGLKRTIVGVEKNPWVMVYSGVSVTSQARKPFFPMGDSHVLSARAFAQPFGATIGPWSKSQWASGSLRSSGSKVDKVMPEVWETGSGSAGPPPALAEENVPNYSKYPGDILGLKSKLALSEIGVPWKNISMSPIKLSYYQTQPLAAMYGGIGQATDLAGRLEGLAVAPNVFDIAHYTIEPQAVKIFNERDGLNLANIAPDYKEQKNGVQGQVEDSVSKGLAVGSMFYRVNNWMHLLTSWVASNPSQYETPSARFGQCTLLVNQGGSPTSGNCVAGGRTGYSVKIVSEEYLNSSNLPLGGEGNMGPILNAPGL